MAPTLSMNLRHTECLHRALSSEGYSSCVPRTHHAICGKPQVTRCPHLPSQVILTTRVALMASCERCHHPHLWQDHPNLVFRPGSRGDQPRRAPLRCSPPAGGVPRRRVPVSAVHHKIPETPVLGPRGRAAILPLDDCGHKEHYGRCKSGSFVAYLFQTMRPT